MMKSTGKIGHNNVYRIRERAKSAYLARRFSRRGRRETINLPRRASFLSAAFPFLLSRKRSLFGDAISPFTERTLKERMRLAHRCCVFPRLDISSAFTAVLLTRAAIGDGERDGRSIPQERRTVVPRRASNRRDTVLTNLQAP